MPVEDNGFLLLRDRRRADRPFCTPPGPSGRTCSHSRSTGASGKLEISGLGGSYGTERVTCYKMSPEMGPPETFAWEYPMADNSWDVEFRGVS